MTPNDRRPNVFAANVIERGGLNRRNPDWVAQQLARTEARIVPVWRSKSLVSGPKRGPVAATLPADSRWWRVDDHAEPIYLGELEGVPYFAADVSGLDDPDAHPIFSDAGSFQDLRILGPFLDPGEASLLAHARGMVWWSERHRFCGVCGAPTRVTEAGYKRVCTNEACKAEHFPRTDPAMIVLVHDGGDRALLGRSARFPEGMYSTLAGFIEPGESLEACVEREVAEEAGLKVTEVRYHSSQPWPFPSSVMLGFFARAMGEEVTLDPDELVDARWFSRAELRDAEATGLVRLPGPVSIARRLVDDWIEGAF